MNNLLNGTGSIHQCHIPELEVLDLLYPYQDPLTYYNRTWPVITKTDATEYGLGTVLNQNGCSFTLTSKTLIDIENHCVNIERQCLSVCFSLNKFLTYIYGSHITVQNDHRPLEMTQYKPIHAISPVYSACVHVTLDYRNMTLLSSINLARRLY